MAKQPRLTCIYLAIGDVYPSTRSVDMEEVSGAIALALEGKLPPAKITIDVSRVDRLGRHRTTEGEAVWFALKILSGLYPSRSRYAWYLFAVANTNELPTTKPVKRQRKLSLPTPPPESVALPPRQTVTPILPVVADRILPLAPKFVSVQPVRERKEKPVQAVPRRPLSRKSDLDDLLAKPPCEAKASGPTRMETEARIHAEYLAYTEQAPVPAAVSVQNVELALEDAQALIDVTSALFKDSASGIVVSLNGHCSAAMIAKAVQILTTWSIWNGRLRPSEEQPAAEALLIREARRIQAAGAERTGQAFTATAFKEMVEAALRPSSLPTEPSAP